MFFEFKMRQMILPLFLCSILFLTSCVDEKNNLVSVPQVRLDSPKYSCLKQAGETLDRYFKAQLSNQEIQTFWNCLDLAIVQFVGFVSGAEGKNYRPEEIVQFLDSYFLSEGELSRHPNLIREFMEIKRLFVGGSVDRVSHHDLFVKTRALLQHFKVITSQLNPHILTYRRGLGIDSGEIQIEHLIAAQNAFKENFRKLGHLLSQSGHHYEFSHLNQFVLELESFLKKSNPDFSLETIRIYMPLFREFKSALTDSSSVSMRPQDWSVLMDWLNDSAFWIGKFRLIEKQGYWGEETQFRSLMEIAYSMVSKVQDQIQSLDTKEISSGSLLRFLVEAKRLNFIKLDLTDQDLKTIVDHSLEKLLQNSKVRNAKGLRSEHLDVLDSEIKRFHKIQKYIQLIHNKNAQQNFGDGVEAIEEFEQIKNTKWNLKLDNKGRLYFSDEEVALSYDLMSLTELNWKRALVRFFMKPYSSVSKSSSVEPLQADQWAKLVQDWSALGVAFGLFDKGKEAAMVTKIMTEANLFTPLANGNDRLDLAEAVHYLSFALSGLSYLQEFKLGSNYFCRSKPNPEVESFVRDCFEKYLIQNRNQLMSSMPRWLNWIGSSDDRLLNYIQLSFRVVLDRPESEILTTGDITKLFMLWHYVESYFATFDENKNSSIQVNETLQSFPIFYYALNEIIGKSYGYELSKEDLRALFTFLFKYGKPPQLKLGGIIKFLHWRWNTDKWQYDAGRDRLVEILAELNAAR